jgi:uncharacterized protein with FMN-binding domain
VTDALPPYPTPPEPRRERPVSLARRVVPAVVILGTAGALLVALDHPGGSTGAGSDTRTDEAALPLDPATSAPSATVAPSTTIAPSAGGAGAARSTTTTVPATPTCSGTTSTVTGSTTQTRYGPVQVQATVDGSGKLCTITALQTPSTDRRSIAINQRAVPTLTQKALAAGNATFSGVSGATYTSNAYKKSLQSILDQK